MENRSILLIKRGILALIKFIFQQKQNQCYRKFAKIVGHLNNTDDKGHKSHYGCRLLCYCVLIIHPPI